MNKLQLSRENEGGWEIPVRVYLWRLWEGKNSTITLEALAICSLRGGAWTKLSWESPRARYKAPDVTTYVRVYCLGKTLAYCEISRMQGARGRLLSAQGRKCSADSNGLLYGHAFSERIRWQSKRGKNWDSKSSHLSSVDPLSVHMRPISKLPVRPNRMVQFCSYIVPEGDVQKSFSQTCTYTYILVGRVRPLASSIRCNSYVYMHTPADAHTHVCMSKHVPCLPPSASRVCVCVWVCVCTVRKFDDRNDLLHCSQQQSLYIFSRVQCRPTRRMNRNHLWLYSACTGCIWLPCRQAQSFSR